ncbi:MAG: type II toxin-antitoxin system HicA family toxin [Syntrophobacteraceae bacterium]
MGYEKVVKALQRDGWAVIRQRGSHIRLHKHTRKEVLKLTIPAHSPIKRSTLAHILKQARLSKEEFESLL